jgi:hypothetical protein
MSSKQKVAVTRAAVIQRIRRKLAREGAMGKLLKKNRRYPDGTLGEYFVVDVQGNYILDKDVDVDELARKTGAIASNEMIED